MARKSNAGDADRQEGEGATIEMGKARIRVTAPAGPRRRAGHSFDKAPRILLVEDMGDTPEEQEAAVKLLLADPMLSVSPDIEEGEIDAEVKAD
jgi:hypothetical protein